MRERHVNLIYAPFSGGCGIAGCELAPEVLRKAGVGPALRTIGRGVSEVSLDLSDCGSAAHATLTQLAEAYRRVSTAVTTSLTGGGLPVVLGGDHSLAIGSLAGVARHCRRRRRPLWVLWLDAHADFNTFATSPSGNVHGMPAAVVCGVGDPRLLVLDDGVPWVDPARLHLIGVRAIDAAESELLRTRPVRISTMTEARRRGLTVVVEEVLERVAADGGHLHVSLDVDVLDPAVAPGVGHREPGGLGADELNAALRSIAASGLLGSLDVMEFDPLRDRDGVTARLTVGLVQCALRACAMPAPAGEEVCDEDAEYAT